MTEPPSPVDFAHLARFTGGDAEVEREVFELFHEQLATWLRLITVEADADDWTDAAHALKGTARGIGAFALAQACEAAEAAAESGRTARAVAAADLRHAAQVAQDAVRARAYRQTLSAMREGDTVSRVSSQTRNS
ncbi:MAG: Hpt domain-containing protein [Maricaulaceae bacterium]